MRAVVQRVKRASVRVEGETVGAIGPGLLVLVGIARDDADADIAYMRRKIVGMRIFEDADGRMNRSLAEVGGGLLLVSQFTLFGDARHGRRPGFTEAMPPESAEAFFARFVAAFADAGVPVATGVFRAMMDVELVNDGPVTILLESRKAF